MKHIDLPAYFKNGSRYTKVISTKECIEVNALQTGNTIYRGSNSHKINDAVEFDQPIDKDMFDRAFKTALEKVIAMS